MGAKRVSQKRPQTKERTRWTTERSTRDELERSITDWALSIYNMYAADLQNAAVANGEGINGKGGTFLVTTGKTGGRQKTVRVRTRVETDRVGQQPPMDPAEVRRRFTRIGVAH